MDHDERKRDTRDKIMLGGLVVKAGLRFADRAFILGALIEAAKHAEGSLEFGRLCAIGNRAFRKDTASSSAGKKERAGDAEEHLPPG